MWCTRMKTAQNKDKTQTKGHYSEMEQTESNRNHIWHIVLTWYTFL